MSAIARLIPLAISAGFFATQGDKMEEVADMAIDAARVVSAKVELANLSRALMTQVGFDSVPENLDLNFPDFVRENLHNSDRSDPAMDPWDNLYQLKILKGEYEIYSLGPDGQANNDDDIWVSVPMR